MIRTHAVLLEFFDSLQPADYDRDTNFTPFSLET